MDMHITVNESIPQYHLTFTFEDNFDYFETKEMMGRFWARAHYWIAAYLAIVFALRGLMKRRQPFVLRKTLAGWNLFLAVFSVMGALRTLPELMHSLNKFGFMYSACIAAYMEHNKVASFWHWIFVCSKVIEFGDTMFLVLRKRPLTFLHVYHHVSVLLFCWNTFISCSAPARWFGVMNFVVHSFMYSYYFARSLNVRMPKSIAVSITAMQIAQMIMGAFVCVYAFVVKNRGRRCDVGYDELKLYLAIYTSYFILFLRFFYNAYVRGPSALKRNAQGKTVAADTITDDETSKKRLKGE